MTAAKRPSASADRRDVFQSGAYWREYYTSLGHENRAAGEFLLEAARPLSRDGRLRVLDAGCGPTLLYWTLFIPGANEVHGFDLSPANVQDSQKQIDDARRGEFNAGLIEAARHAIHLLSEPAEPEDYVASKARQVVSVIVGDLRQRWPHESERFDFVQSCFALESLPDWPSFDAALDQACRVLRPGGCLALVNGLEGTNWICDNHSFPTLFVTAASMREKIERRGLRVQFMREVKSGDTNWRDQGYNKVLLASATKLKTA